MHQDTNCLNFCKNWCRLCGKEHLQTNMKYENKMEKNIWQEHDEDEEEHMDNMNLANAIEKYLNIKLINNMQLPQTICNECYALTITLINFSKRVAKVQFMYENILNIPTDTISNIDLKNLRKKYDLPIEFIDTKENIKKENVPQYAYDEEEEMDLCKSSNTNISPIFEENINKIQDRVINRKENYLKGKRSTIEIQNCRYCMKKFSSKKRLQQHIKTMHINERSFICEECGITVRTNSALKAHMLTHTDYAPFECKICNKTFKNQIRLKNHLETHDPNKHVCAECGLQLNSRATLNRHLLVHSDEMQHKCDYCGRAFKRAKALKNHLILHTGLKPYSCDFCERTFANGSNCRSHKKKAHPVELAALEASGGGRTYTKNIPKLEALKAVTKTTDNLTPVVTKQSGRFAFGKKPKITTTEYIKDTTTTTAITTTTTTSNLNQLDINSLELENSAIIPTFDNIYCRNLITSLNDNSKEELNENSLTTDANHTFYNRNLINDTNFITTNLAQTGVTYTHLRENIQEAYL